MAKPTYSAETLREWIETCLDEGINLTDWETSFLESISDQLDRRGSLSEGQVETLERIYAHKTP